MKLVFVEVCTTMRYDYLIVGAGLFGSICAHELTKKGKKCMVIDKNSFVGGNCHSTIIKGISVSTFGPHILHTNNKVVWDYLNNLTSFSPIHLANKVYYKGKFYSFPINLFTLHQLWGTNTPEEAEEILKHKRVNISNPKNFEEYYLSTIGQELYEIFIEGYSKKQWKIPLTDLDCSVAKRLPIRFTFNDNYFYEKYCGVPENGYMPMFNYLLKNITVTLNTDFTEDRKYWNSIANQIIFSGRIDQYYQFQYGPLEYRTTKFVREHLNINHFQGCGVINYTEESIPFTRIVEYKYLTPQCKNTTSTIIVREYPDEWEENKNPMYPINTPKNKDAYHQYFTLASTERNVHFGGRLGAYSYMNMDCVVKAALKMVSICEK